VVAVLALYRIDQDAFTREELSVLQALTSQVGFEIQKILQRTQPAIETSTLAASAGGD
jgi:GAF domain-containing protein